MSATVSQLNRRASALFLLAVLMAAAWLAVGFFIPETATTGIPLSVVMILIGNVVILLGLWLGVSRTDSSGTTRVKVWLAIAVPLALWIGIIWYLAVHGTFRRGIFHTLPTLPPAILLPLVAGLVPLLRSRRIASLLDVMPAAWLIGLQVTRVLGGTFLVYWARGEMPGAFALPAGIGDVLVGLLALPAAAWVASGTPIGRKIGIAWNLLGLTDFAVAIATGIMTSPGPAHVLALGHPNVQIAMFPAVMIPAFAVPNLMLLHVLSLWQLRRLGSKSADPCGSAKNEHPALDAAPAL